VPFAGPTVKTLRLTFTGTENVAIGYSALESVPDASTNLLTSTTYGSATYMVSFGSASSAVTSWQGTTSTTPHQAIAAGAYVQVALSGAVENAGSYSSGS
jgi:hypothetical protein